jgi:drug/metabolite transporter (DMT)-like permease
MAMRYVTQCQLIIDIVENYSEKQYAKTLAITFLALTAFAANSVLCRLALGANTIDASSFTVIRLLSGALALLALLKINNKEENHAAKGSWSASIVLFLYAITFSFAYITLDTGTGALILFGSVQITMIMLSIISGNRLYVMEWLGILIAFFGLFYLVLPGISTPSVFGFSLMTIAGIAWGIYTIKGRGSDHPLIDTAYNFLRTLPFVFVLAIVSFQSSYYTLDGVLLAVLSGGIASGMGYTIWYIALRRITATQAAVVQLSVPVIAALGGVIFVAEMITARLIISSAMILGGIFLVLMGRHYVVAQKITSRK